LPIFSINSFYPQTAGPASGLFSPAFHAGLQARGMLFILFPFSAVPNYPQNPLDFSTLSAYFINTYPAVLQSSYRLSGAALLNTYSDTYCGVNTRYAFY
jgi:hypothetical protein